MSPSSTVSVTRTDQTVTIGNNLLSRTFSTANHHWQTQCITNHRTKRQLVPEPGSEDFVIHFAAPHDAMTIASSQLTAKTYAVTNGHQLRAEFAPVTTGKVTWQITQVITMADTQHYMTSHLELTTDQPEAMAIDYIDLNRFVLADSVTNRWCIPPEEQVSSLWMGKHELMLGQPVYADGLFFGSEFPAAETSIDQATIQMRYYSGKTLAKMAQDQQHGSVNANTYHSWPSVIGASAGLATSTVQRDFFAYIDAIATPTTLRKQYNSWYDNMMQIDDASIKRSFLGAEKGLAQNGVAPLDAYVVDDGWNNYYNPMGNVPANDTAGTTANQTGFWEFNAKFKDELYPAAELANRLNSHFGLWVGPQGGYNYYMEFAEFLEQSGTGEVQTTYRQAIDVASRTYQKYFEKRFLDYQQRFNINYWKWDGFALRPCDNPDHNHMVGGAHNMYCVSDQWEGWLSLFAHFRQANPALWINATCYVNLSPWLLQWVNSIWVQDSDDTGEAANAGAARHQQKIYYRDHVYHNLYQHNQLQFPQKNVYNHEPIFGVSDHSEASTAVFREYLLANAMRGTAFWELHFSPAIMDEEKWMVVADVLAFVEQNFDVLQTSKLFEEPGTFTSNNLREPVAGMYGYAAWRNQRGIVSFVNPTASERTYKLTLDEHVGVTPAVQQLPVTQVFPYTSNQPEGRVSYGDVVTVTLPPHSSRILQYGAVDATVPVMQSAKQTQSGVRVRFNVRMRDDLTFTVDGQPVAATLLADYRTFELADVSNATGKQLSVKTVSSAAGIKGKAVTTTIATDGPIVDRPATIDQPQPLAEHGISGSADFSVATTVTTTATDVTLLQQGNEWQLTIDSSGYACFTVGKTELSSHYQLTRVTQKAHGQFSTAAYQPTTTQVQAMGQVNDGQPHRIVAVRELSGALKLYLDGELAATTYQPEHHQTLSGAAITAGAGASLSDPQVVNRALFYNELNN